MQGLRPGPSSLPASALGRRRVRGTAALAILALAAGSCSSAPPLVPTASAQAMSPAPSPTSAPSTPDASGSLTVTIPTPDGAPTTPAATSSASPASALLALASGDGVSTEWSPDGLHLLVRTATTNGPREAQRVDLFEQDGDFIRTYQGADDAIWLDVDRFLLYSWERRPISGGDWEIVYGPAGETRGSVLLGSVATDDLVDIDAPPRRGMSNRNGAAAVVVHEEALAASFVVWSPEDGLSDEHDGYPISWSLDGTALAVMHLTRGGNGREGWLEVLRWPAMETMVAARDVTVGPDARFDPTGRFLAFLDYGPLAVLDLASTSQSFIGVADEFVTRFAWLDAGRVATVTGDGSASAYDAEGNVTHTWEEVGDALVAAGDGSAVMFYYLEPEPTLGTDVVTIVRGPTQLRIKPPSPLWGPDPELAPGGSAVTLPTLINGSATLLLYRP